MVNKIHFNLIENVSLQVYICNINNVKKKYICCQILICFGFNNSIIKLHFGNMLSLFIALDILINVTVGVCTCFFFFFGFFQLLFSKDALN